MAITHVQHGSKPNPNLCVSAQPTSHIEKYRVVVCGTVTGAYQCKYPAGIGDIPLGVAMESGTITDWISVQFAGPVPLIAGQGALGTIRIGNALTLEGTSGRVLKTGDGTAFLFKYGGTQGMILGRALENATPDQVFTARIMIR